MNPFDDMCSFDLGCPWETLVYVDGIGTLGLVLVLLFVLYRWRSVLGARQRLDSAPDRNELPISGEASVVGVVEYGPEATECLRFDAEETRVVAGYHHGTTYGWAEIARRVRPVPFDLVRQDGSRIRVEPGAAFWEDDLDHTTELHSKGRRRWTEIRPGESIAVVGQISRNALANGSGEGYRSAPQSAIIVSAPGRQIQMSRRTPARWLDALARAHRTALIAACVIFVAVHASLYGFHADRWTGVVTTGTVTALSQAKAKTAGQLDEYVVSLRVPSLGITLNERIDRADFERMSQGTTLPVRYVPRWPSMIHLGAHATTSSYPALAALAGPIVAIATYLLLLLSLRGLRPIPKVLGKQ